MADAPKLAPNRIVSVVLGNDLHKGAVRPAICVEAYPNGTGDFYVLGKPDEHGIQFRPKVPMSDETSKLPGTWFWPARS